MVAIILTIFLPDNQLTKFRVHLLVDYGFLSPPSIYMKHRGLVPTIGWTPVTDTRDKLTCLSVRPSVRSLRHTGSKTGADFRSRKSEASFGTCVMRKRIRFSTPIRMCSILRVHAFQKHVIDRNSCEWLKSIVFAWLVCKQCRIGENTFRLRFLLFVSICNDINA